MSDLAALRSVDLVDDKVLILDQTRLPAEQVTIVCTDTPTLVEAIASLRVRGAPAIGIAGAFGVAAAAVRCSKATRDGARALAALEAEAAILREARPTAVNLGWAVDRVMSRLRSAAASGTTSSELAELSLIEAFAIRSEDVDSCLHMAKHARALIPDGARILTHCNTGLLCTGGIGTALGAIRQAHEEGAGIEVFVCETRPLLQGARLTAWELSQLGIPHHLIVDGAAAGLILGGQVDLVLVGADRIAANGDTANKVGTLAHALAAAAAGIPFYVVAPNSTIDRTIRSGDQIPIESRPAAEVLDLLEHPGTDRALNPAFDVTPARLISAIITESGAHRTPFRL
ncbi:MAG: S-methyl-5-thioribose-1-phosphate isomerase [Actinomycetota bacterium]